MKLLNDNQTVIRLPNELKMLLKFYSNMFHVTQSEFIREAIIKQIKRARDRTI